MASDLKRSLTKFGLGQTRLSLSILSDAGVSLEFKGEVISALGEIAGCIKTAQNIFISRDIYDQKSVLSLNIQEAQKKLDPILKNDNLDSFDFAAGIKLCGKILKILEKFVEAFPNSDKSHEETLKLRAACKQLRDLDIAAKS